MIAAPLTNVQLELLKLFQYQVDENQILEIRDILSKYFAEKATKEIDKLWEENNWNNDKMESWANEHL
jgi:hypothetical protein